MPTVVSISDLHLDTRTQGVRRFEEVKSALWQAAREAARREADLFACAGDVGDPDSGLIVYPLLALLIEVSFFLSRAGVNQLWCKGNHDGDEHESLLTPLEMMCRFTTCSRASAVVAEVPQSYVVPTAEGGFRVVALPHGKYDPDAAVRAFAEQRLPGMPVLVVSHTYPIRGLEDGEETTEMSRGGPCPFPHEALAEMGGNVYVLSGHYHKRQSHQPPVGPRIEVVGSACQLSHSEESNQPGYLVMEF